MLTRAIDETLPASGQETELPALTPTLSLAELSGDAKDSFTTSVALVGPPAIDPNEVVSLAAAFFRGVSTDTR